MGEILGVDGVPPSARILARRPDTRTTGTSDPSLQRSFAQQPLQRLASYCVEGTVREAVMCAYRIASIVQKRRGYMPLQRASWSVGYRGRPPFFRRVLVQQ